MNNKPNRTRFTVALILVTISLWIFYSALLSSSWPVDAAQDPNATLPPKKPISTKKPPPAKKPAPPRKRKPVGTTPKKPSSNSLDPTPGTVVLNRNGMELVWIPAGTFMMGSTTGSADEKPVHQVNIRQPFFIGKHEVTQEQWQVVMGNNPSHFKDCGNCPVESVSWGDAQAFIKRLNEMNEGYRYRLPTEAEWEYACRAGTTGIYAGELKEMAWFSENSGGRTHAVGQRKVNAWGLADMHGNVWEWCEDWYHETYYGAPSNGGAWLSGGEQKERVMRGGSWVNEAIYARSAERLSRTPSRRINGLGFRVVAVR